MVVEEMGSGPPVVFIHGGGLGGAQAWRAQWPLAERWRLIFPNRPGYGGSPLAGREDFEVDAGLIAELLGPGAHLIGHSYGGVIALLAAARRPEAVWTLTTVECPASAVARDDPAVAAFEQALFKLNGAPPDDPDAYLRQLFAILEPAAVLPPALRPELLTYTRHLQRNFRWPSEAVIPLDVLQRAPFPKLFLTGGHGPAYEAIADALALELGGDRRILDGGGHAPQTSGPRFNELVEAFMRAKVR